MRTMAHESIILGQKTIEILVCFRRSDECGERVEIVHRENGGGAGGGSKRLPSPFPLLVSPRFCFFVNFSPALYYLRLRKYAEST